MKIKYRGENTALNGRFGVMAAVAPQTILCGNERLYPAGSHYAKPLGRLSRQRMQTISVLKVNFTRRFGLQRKPFTIWSKKLFFDSVNNKIIDKK